MKKSWLILGFFALAVFMVSQVSAFDLSYELEKALNVIIQFLQPIFGTLLNEQGEFLFEKVLFLTIILCVVYLSLSKFGFFKSEAGQEKKALIWIVTIAVSLLATRFLAETDVVQNILLPYSVLGIALTAGIPLIIFFYFNINTSNTVIRKILWILFLVVFLGLWWERYDNLGSLSWVYFFTGIVALIFFLADGTIRRYMVKRQLEELGKISREDFSAKLRDQLFEAKQQLDHNSITPAQYARRQRILNDKLKALNKH